MKNNLTDNSHITIHTGETSTNAVTPNSLSTQPQQRPYHGKIRAKIFALCACLLACVVCFTGCQKKSAVPRKTLASAPTQPVAKTETPKSIHIADLDFVLLPIPAGSFQMGSDKHEDDMDVRTVTISKPFWIGKYAVTQKQYEKLMGKNPSKFIDSGSNAPVEMVSYDDAVAYCAKLNEIERAAGRLPAGYEYRLPTEAEWEYACRAGTSGDFSFSGGAANMRDYGNYQGNGHTTTVPVGSYKVNPWGLYDMHGNVWEWCLDWYEDGVGNVATTDPTGPRTGGDRVMRGGSWADSAQNCRTTIRERSGPSYRYGYVGFRLGLAPVVTNSGSSSSPATVATLVPPQVASVASVPTQALLIPDLDLTMQPISAGSFMMGSPESEPECQNDETQHRVTITKPFWLGKYPVTQEQYEKLMGKNPSNFKEVGKNAPVEQVLWNDAMAFCEKLNERERAAGRLPEGYKYTLPTESEWEYACRAGTTTPFSFGSTLNGEQANCNGNYPYGTKKKGIYLGETSPVGNYPANAWGLYDMHGNVWEWCADWSGSYPTGDVTDPVGPASGTYRVLRGGSWGNLAQYCRSADRGGSGPGYRNVSIGFRLALKSVR